MLSLTIINKSLFWRTLGLAAVVSLFVICILPDNLIQTALVDDDQDSASLGSIITSTSLNKYPRNKDNALDWSAMILLLASASLFSLGILSSLLAIGTQETSRDVSLYRRNRSPPFKYFSFQNIDNYLFI